MRKEILLTGAAVLALLFASSGASALQTPAQQKPAPAVQDEKNKPASEKQASSKSSEALKKYLEGQRLEQTGNYSGAVAAFKEAIALDPSSADLRTALGSLYLKNRNIIDAESQAREAMKLAPESLDVRKLITRIYLAQVFTGTTLDKEKARAAIKELEEIVRLDQGAKLDVNGQEQPALTLIGSLYLTLEEEDKAIEALKRV
ncbi:MAG TPA: tetratricopeptide repeat protein, partial [Blastocatellia bacterium]|nr:tetratricopeptide repeat protein [Blastocatellia bacterium]